VRRQRASPCDKKGIDNSELTNACELVELCKQCGDFNNKHSARYKLCLKVEESLTQQQLIRYEAREMAGLEILFEGLEKIYNLNAEILKHDQLEGVSPNDLPLMALTLERAIDRDLKEDRLFKNSKQRANETPRTGITKASVFNHLPEFLGFAQSFSHELLSCAPDNLFDSVFQTLYLRGEFDPQYVEIKNEAKPERQKRELKDDDLHTVATILFHGIEDERHIKQIWQRFTPTRMERNKIKVYQTVGRKMSRTFRKFPKLWNKLTEAQEAALKLEYFYEGQEKPTQKENAKRLGISVASYQDRLEGAYKHLMKLYSEFERIERKKK